MCECCSSVEPSTEGGVVNDDSTTLHFRGGVVNDDPTIDHHRYICDD